MNDGPLKLVTAEPPCAEVVEKLRTALATAEKGEMSSVAIAWVDREGVCSTLWSKAPSKGTLAGAITALLHDFMDAWGQ